jgi:hypothetical protein
MSIVKKLNDWGEGKENPENQLTLLKAIKNRLGWIIFFLIVIAVGVGNIGF